MHVRGNGDHLRAFAVVKTRHGIKDRKFYREHDVASDPADRYRLDSKLHNLGRII